MVSKPKVKAPIRRKPRTVDAHTEMSAREIAGLLAGAATPAIVFTLAFAVLPLRAEFGIGQILMIGLLVAVVPVAVRFARRVNRSNTPLADAAGALSMIVSALVIGFSGVYYTMAVHSHHEIAGLHTKVDALYFTTTVISTVGFGDIHADGQAARVVVTINILFNLVALGTSIKLVSWAARSRAEGLRSAGEPLD